ncbi:hypothetical protein [uncultured Flavobacterium sp.]|uniref:hypothetical protein n=1 Tax=uncultured Flavobacterium sp. TaxID=165435 RepID=UPI0025EECF30|nr:hypothetical protein [uncultured Flavobacterium sp.]
MNKQEVLTELLQYHTVIERFNYSFAVEWAMYLLEQGNTNDDILMLASFSEPIDSFEIQPYLSRALTSMNLNQKQDKDTGLLLLATYYILDILDNNNIISNLQKIESLYFDTKFSNKLTPFLSLYYAWGDLDNNMDNYSYPEATLDNIESIVKREAKLFIDTVYNTL